MRWIPLAADLRQFRERRGMSVATLAERASVTERTIRRMESGTQRSARLDTLTAVAKALGCRIEAIAQRPPGAAPRLTVRTESAPPLTEAVLADISVAYHANRSHSFAVTGRVQAHAALTRLEWIALHCRPRDGARFTLALPPFDTPLRVTLHTQTAKATRALQSALRAGTSISMIATVRVLPSGAEHPTVPDAQTSTSSITLDDAAYFAANWRGFPHEGEPHPLLWTLVVE